MLNTKVCKAASLASKDINAEKKQHFGIFKSNFDALIPVSWIPAVEQTARADVGHCEPVWLADLTPWSITSTSVLLRGQASGEENPLIHIYCAELNKHKLTVAGRFATAGFTPQFKGLQ